MNKFEFKKAKIEMEIAGTVYTIGYNGAETVKKFTDIAGCIKETANELATTDNIDLACGKIDQQIDRMLGKGSSKQIFDGRPNSIFERIDVLNFIVGEIQSFGGKNK